MARLGEKQEQRLVHKSGAGGCTLFPVRGAERIPRREGGLTGGPPLLVLHWRRGCAHVGAGMSDQQVQPRVGPTCTYTASAQNAFRASGRRAEPPSVHLCVAALCPPPKKPQSPPALLPTCLATLSQGVQRVPAFPTPAGRSTLVLPGPAAVKGGKF